MNFILAVLTSTVAMAADGVNRRTFLHGIAAIPTHTVLPVSVGPTKAASTAAITAISPEVKRARTAFLRTALKHIAVGGAMRADFDRLLIFRRTHPQLAAPFAAQIETNYQKVIKRIQDTTQGLDATFHWDASRGLARAIKLATQFDVRLIDVKASDTDRMLLIEDELMQTRGLSPDEVYDALTFVFEPEAVVRAAFEDDFAKHPPAYDEELYQYYLRETLAVSITKAVGLHQRHQQTELNPADAYAQISSIKKAFFEMVGLVDNYQHQPDPDHDSNERYGVGPRFWFHNFDDHPIVWELFENLHANATLYLDAILKAQIVLKNLDSLRPSRLKDVAISKMTEVSRDLKADLDRLPQSLDELAKSRYMKHLIGYHSNPSNAYNPPPSHEWQPALPVVTAAAWALLLRGMVRPEANEVAAGLLVEPSLPNLQLRECGMVLLAPPTDLPLERHEDSVPQKILVPE